MSKTKKIVIRETKDGSTTLYISEMDETYHSSHGAIQEAKHVFIKNGLELIDKDSIDVLEVGFGTGLNALLTCDFSFRTQKLVHYVGLETVPLSEELISKLNYLSHDPKLSPIHFNQIHSSQWEKKVKIHDFFSAEKNNISVQEYQAESNFDIIFYDAFGPRAQQEMWQREIFEKLFETIRVGGMLVTYCAMGQFKRDLRSIGFEVQNVPGPPGKREMTIARKLS